IANRRRAPIRLAGSSRTAWGGSTRATGGKAGGTLFTSHSTSSTRAASPANAPYRPRPQRSRRSPLRTGYHAPPGAAGAAAPSGAPTGRRGGLAGLEDGNSFTANSSGRLRMQAGQRPPASTVSRKSSVSQKGQFDSAMKAFRKGRNDSALRGG